MQFSSGIVKVEYLSNFLWPTFMAVFLQNSVVKYTIKIQILREPVDKFSISFHRSDKTTSDFSKLIQFYPEFFLDWL